MDMSTLQLIVTTCATLVSAAALVVLVFQSVALTQQARSAQQQAEIARQQAELASENTKTHSDQLSELRKSLAASTCAVLYQQQCDISRFFLRYDDLRAYFYDEKIPGEEMPEIEAAAELLTDFFEHIFIQKEVLEPDVYKGWQHFMRDMYTRSVALRQFIDKRHAWYDPRLHAELVPQKGHP